MSESALLLLKDNPVAQRLVVAWPRVPVTKKRGDRKRRVRLWAKLAGVSERATETYHDMLFENEVCRPDGTVDALAAGYVTRVALAGLPRAMVAKGA